MTKEIIQAQYETYLKAYSSLATDERQRLLSSLVSEDVVSLLPNAESHGLQELEAHIEGFAAQSPDATFARRTFSFNHGQFLADIRLHAADGSGIATARTYGRVTEEGLFSYFVGFF